MKPGTISSVMKNRLCWILGILSLSLLMTTPAFAYNSTQKQTITRAGQLSTFRFTSLPRSSSNVTIKVSVYGDFEASNEYADVWADGRQQTRITGETTTCNTTVTANRGTRTYTLPASNVADGNLLIYVRNSSAVGTSCRQKEIVVQVSYTNAPQSELTIAAVKVPTSGGALAAGATWQGQYTITNSAADLTTNFYVSFYYCPSNRTTGCVYMGRQLITQDLKKGAKYTFTSTALRIPSRVQSGTRYIRAFVDSSNGVSETNETNNNLYSRITITSPRADLTVDILTVAPTAAYPGARLTIRYRLRNVGSATATFNSRLYWSTDATITAADTYLNHQRSLTLRAGQASTTYTTYVTLGTTQALGTFYLGMFADYNNAVRELSEVNNTRAVKVTVTAEKPDLQISASTVPSPNSNLSANATFVGRYTVRNNGGPNKIDFAIQYFYCPTTSTTGCVSLGKQTITKDMNKGETHSFNSISLKIPSNATNGTRYIRAVVDADNKVAETVENNNVDLDAINIVSRRADLIVETLTLNPSSAKQNGKVTVTYKVKNIGTATATNFVLRLYYSTNNFITTRDVYLNHERTVASLAAGASSAAFTATITVPSNATIGTGYIGAIVDYNSRVTELNESNNTKFATLTVQGTPDLSINYIAISPTTAGPGANLTVTFRVYNGGTDKASNFKVRLYFSNNAAIDGTDTYLGIERTITTLNARTSSSYYRVTVTVPANATAGARYVGAWVDHDKKVAESNENNNTRVAALRIPSAADLVVDVLGLNPTSSTPGGKVTVTYRVANRGTATASNFIVGLYWSYRSDLGSGRSFNQNKTVASLAAGKTTATYTATVTVPTGLSAGQTIYIGAWADPTRRVAEISETNNIKSGRLAIIGTKPDLIFTSSTVPSSGTTVSAGGSFTGRYTIRNNGPKVTKDFVVRYLLCRTTSSTSCSTTPLANQTITKDLNPGESYSFTTPTLKLAASTPTGTRYVLAILDATNQVAEASETNNRDLDSINVIAPRADLQVEILTVTPLTAAPGGSVNVSYRIFNAGGADAGNSTFRLYLSSNTTITTSDTYLGHERTLALKANTRSTTYTVKVTIPSRQSLGVWHLGGIADYRNQIREANESNNTRYVRMTLAQGKPDLQAVSVTSAITQQRVGGTVSLVYKITNVGPSTFTQLPVFFYFSTDATITGADQAVGLANLNFTPGQTVTASITVRVPANAKAGTGYFGFLVDPANAVKESNESNNTASTKMLVLTDADKDGYWYAPGCPASVKDCDCQDNDKTINPKAKELCDGKDNNCDGKVDEGCGCTDGKTQDCGSDTGECKKGKQTCKAGKWGACVGEVKAAKELCDGKDNDCDGKTDEDFADKGKACSVGKGVCQSSGKYVCKTDGSGLSCDAKVIKPGKELCNGKDDDCDGQTDEDFSDLGNACSIGQGVCKSSGKYVCKTDGSAAVCDAKVIKPGTETCNGKDDDCDGQTDEDGVCNEPNQEPTPDGGTEPTPDGGSEPTPDTPDVTPDTNTDAGPDAQPDTADCYTTGCPAGKICKEGKCTDDPCDGVSCKNNEFCRDGLCVQACGCKQCPSGEYCVDGVCEKDSCQGVTCAADEICNKTNGQCEPDQCKNVTCASGRVCDANSGTCIDDSCNYINCPGSLVCKGGQCVGVQCSTEPTPDGEPSQEVVTDEPGVADDGGSSDNVTDTTPDTVADTTPDTVADTTPDTVADTSPDAAVGDKTTGGTGDKATTDDTAPAGGCECSTNNTGGLSFLLFFLLMIPAIRRRRR